MYPPAGIGLAFVTVNVYSDIYPVLVDPVVLTTFLVVITPGMSVPVNCTPVVTSSTVSQLEFICVWV